MSEPLASTTPWWRSRKLHAAVAAVAVVGVVLGLVWHARRLPSDAAFRVDDTVVTKTQMRSQATAMRALYGIELPDDAKKRSAYWRDLAKSDALGRVLARQAAARHLEVSTADATQTLEKFVEGAYGPGSDGKKAFADALVTAGTSRDAVVREIQRQLLTLKLYDDVTRSVPKPSTSSTKAAFRRWSCHFDTPERRQIRNIVVLDRATAQEVRDALDGGAPFAAQVASYSRDQATVDKGGDLGLRRQDEFEPAFGKAAFGAARGSYFGPVKTEGGWNVGVVDRVVASVPARFAHVKGSVALAELNQLKSTKWRSWISDRLKDADVDYADQYRPSDPFAAPAAGVRGEEDLADCPGGD